MRDETYLMKVTPEEKYTFETLILYLLVLIIRRIEKGTPYLIVNGCKIIIKSSMISFHFNIMKGIHEQTPTFSRASLKCDISNISLPVERFNSPPKIQRQMIILTHLTSVSSMSRRTLTCVYVNTSASM